MRSAQAGLKTVMSTPGIILGIAAVLSVTVAVGWRVLSRRTFLPCPSSLSWLLENPMMEGVAGGAALIERSGVQPGMAVLDAGCGPGRLTIPLARHVGAQGHVVALDAQRSMLMKLTERMTTLGISNIRTLCARLGTGALGSERFERAFLVTVLGEIPNQEDALSEIYEHLNPGGLLTICEVLPDPHYQSQAAVWKIAKRTGFTPQVVYRNYRSYTMNLTRPSVPDHKNTSDGGLG